MIPTEEIGGVPLPTGSYNIGIDTVKTITMPSTAQRAKFGSIMELLLSVEIQNARITMDGSTPSTVNGVLLVAPGVLTVRGETQIAAMKIIGVAAGGIINYTFTVGEAR